MMKMWAVLMVVSVGTLWGCRADGQALPAAQAAPPSSASSKGATAATPEAQPQAKLAAPSASLVDASQLKEAYAWLQWTDGLGKLEQLHTRFEAPPSFERVEVKPDSFAAYLRALPLRTDRHDVRLYNGRPSPMPSAGIVPLDLGTKDLHQCADSVIRLHAEYLWSQGKADLAQYHYTSGDLARWADWRRGKLLKVRKNKVVQVQSAGAKSDYAAYRRYLDDVFMYASTRSLHRDAQKIKVRGSYEAGDFFLTAGSPGHVVIVLDVAQDAKGRQVGLLGQGYLPARDFHVIKGAGDRVLDGVWFLLPDKTHEELVTPTWSPFSADGAWRFKER